MEDKPIKKHVDIQSKHFGVADLSIHYTLGAGVAEQLGDKVEEAIFACVPRLLGDNKSFYFDGAVIRIEPVWRGGMLSVHLSNDPHYNQSISVDWICF